MLCNIPKYMFICYYLYVEKIQMLKQQYEQVQKMNKKMIVDLDKREGTD